MNLKLFYTVHERNYNMFLKPMYVVVDKDGDFVDACSGRMPAAALNGVLERTANAHPEYAPFRILKWTGKDWYEVTAVS